MKTHVYVGQYGYFWKLTLDEWIGLCKGVLDGEGYNLDNYKILKRRPYFIVRDHNADDSVYYWTIKENIVYVEPLDWEVEDFKSWLKEHEQQN